MARCARGLWGGGACRYGCAAQDLASARGPDSDVVVLHDGNIPLQAHMFIFKDGTSPPEVTNVLFEGSFDENRQFSLLIRAIAVKGHRIHTVLHDTQGKLVYDKTEDVDASWFSLGDMDGNLNIVTADPSFDVVNADETLTLEWSAMSAKNLPDPGAAK